MIAAGLGGFVFGLLYLGTGRNLWVAVVAHGTMDTVGFLLLFSGSIPVHEAARNGHGVLRRHNACDHGSAPCASVAAVPHVGSMEARMKTLALTALLTLSIGAYTPTHAQRPYDGHADAHKDIQGR